MFNSTKAKRDSHGVWWCAARTTIKVSMERVFGVTVFPVILKVIIVEILRFLSTKRRSGNVKGV